MSRSPDPPGAAPTIASRRLGQSRNRTACLVVTDSAGQKLAYVYFEDEPG